MSFCDADRSVLKDRDEFNRQWIGAFVDLKVDPLTAEWALAWFALDNMKLQACYAAARARELRHSSGSPTEIESQVTQLIDPILTSHQRWRERKVVVAAYEVERIGRRVTALQDSVITPILPAAQSPVVWQNPFVFLDSEPMSVTNSFFANLLNHHRSIELYLSLILRPQWGTHDARRFNCAVDLCRTFASLGDEPNVLTMGKLWGLLLAGITFGGEEFHAVYSYEVPDSRKSRNGLLIGWKRLGLLRLLKVRLQMQNF
jgi:hypothetical protein